MSHHQPEQSFDQWFWPAYPRHVAKQQARKAWIALDPDDQLVVVILNALRWQRQQWTDLKFCPHPATYIRHERWTDEPPPAPTPVLTRFASLGVRERKH